MRIKRNIIQIFLRNDQNITISLAIMTPLIAISLIPALFSRTQASSRLERVVKKTRGQIQKGLKGVFLIYVNSSLLPLIT